MAKSHEAALTQMRKSVHEHGFSAEVSSIPTSGATMLFYSFASLLLEGKVLPFYHFTAEIKFFFKNYGDPSLMRFLIARSMDVEKAAKLFVQWRKWRSSFVPLGYIPDSEVPYELGTKKIFLQGLSKCGLPLLIVRAENHSPSKDQLQFKKFVVHLLDKAITSSHKGKEIGNEKIIAILDLNRLSYKNVDPRGLIVGFQSLQSYYPERLAKCFILNMPWFFVSIWKMVSRFLEKATLEKIVMVTNEDERENFINEIGIEALPEEYGGQAKITLIQYVKLTMSEDSTPQIDEINHKC